MNLWKKLSALALTAVGLTAVADVPELANFVPDGVAGYETICKFNPLTYSSKGYEIDRSEAITGKLTRLAYFMRLTDKQDKTTWVYITMDPFTQNLAEVVVPDGTAIHQEYVNNLQIVSNAEDIVTGTIPKGFIEFWPFNYGGNNAKGVPGASDATFDFGDAPATNGSYTSMQICNYLDKQVVFAFNRVNDGANCEVGIGNNTTIVPNNGNSKTPNPDWTFTSSGKLYKDAQIIVAGKFDDFKVDPDIKPFDASKVYIVGKTDKNFYKVGEPIVFTFTVDMADNKNVKPGYHFKWTRTGDDGKTEGGLVTVEDMPFVYTTSLDKPGFVRIQGNLYNHKGRILKKNKYAESSVFFDGGAAVEPEKLQGVPEPADFDEFWAQQKAKLNAVEFIGKATMTLCHSENPKVKIYAVSVPCAGPRPVTGYLTIPADAKPNSLKAYCSYHGYNGGPGSYQKAPNNGREDAIHFNVNAHGYDLGKDQAYAEAFFKSINVDGTTYGFSSKLNANRDTAYFNGMTMRVMRSLQFVMSLPEWNGKDLIAQGGSQGGLQTIWAAGLEPKVTEANSGITWCCDMRGKESFGRIHGGWRIVGTPALDYFDPINIAKRIPKTCKTTITRAGLGDYTCPPSGLAILYNNIPTNKRINWVQGSTHGFVPPFKGNQTFFVQSEDYE